MSDPGAGPDSVSADDRGDLPPIRRVGRRRVRWRPAWETSPAAVSAGYDEAADRAQDEPLDAARDGSTHTTDPPRPSTDDPVRAPGDARDAWLQAQRPPHWE